MLCLYGQDRCGQLQRDRRLECTECEEVRGGGGVLQVVGDLEDVVLGLGGTEPGAEGFEQRLVQLAGCCGTSRSTERCGVFGVVTHEQHGCVKDGLGGDQAALCRRVVRGNGRQLHALGEGGDAGVTVGCKRPRHQAGHR